MSDSPASVFAAGRLVCRLVLLSAVLTAALPGFAQSAISVSNLGESSGGAGNSDAYVAESFTTDAFASTLSSVDLSLLSVFNGTPDVTLAIYSNNGLDLPGTSLETLSLSGTLGAGSNTFTSTGLSLAANTTYWVVLATSSYSVFGPQAVWARTASTNETNTGGSAWSIGDQYYTSDTDLSSLMSGGGAFKMSVSSQTVSAVPEPATYAVLAGLAVLGLAAWRRRGAARG